MITQQRREEILKQLQTMTKQVPFDKYGPLSDCDLECLVDDLLSELIDEPHLRQIIRDIKKWYIR